MKLKNMLVAMSALAGLLCWGNEIYYDTVGGLTWGYTVSDGSATVYGGSFEEWDDEEEGYVEAYYPAIPDDTSGAITVPTSLGGYPVTAIGDGAFCECHYLTSVTVPVGVVTIGEEAFTDCESMVDVTLPEGLRSIGDDAFDGCGKLKSVTLPASLNSIGSRAFDDCSSLSSVKIPSKVKTIGYHAFARDYGLKSVEAPERLRAQITENAVFYKCSPKITYYSPVPVITFDANGGKIGSQTKVTRACDGDDEEEVYTYVMPDDPVKAGGDFDGWWTAKDGGVQVENGAVVDLSVFANAKTPTLYAQWRMAHKITVSGGFLDDETTTRSGLYRGDEVGAEIDWSKLYDRDENEVNAFAHWSYTPASAVFGDGFNPLESDVTVSMPNADVKLTANYVNGFAGYLQCGYSIDGMDAQGNTPEGDFYWSVDNGKTLLPFVDYGYPVKAGKVTVKFYDKTGKWRAADITTTVDKRGTYKEDGVTRYDDPETTFVFAKFVAVDNSTKVKLDLNGGTGAGEAFFANGWEYGPIDMPSRKGYVFAGWWTAKDGGEHITQDKIFDPADFAGQKTPTLYAHWLQMRKLTLKDESAYAYWDLDDVDIEPELFDEIYESFYKMYPDFEGYGELEGKGVLEVLPGALVSVEVDDSVYDRNDDELVFQKWTVTPSKANLGPDFRVTESETELTMPNEDVTLQATYIDGSTCGVLSATAYADSIDLGYDPDLDDFVYIEPPFDAFEWSPDGGKTWYKAASNGSYWVDDGYWDDESGQWVDDGYWAYYEGEDALLKAGTYTVTWRSNDPSWQAPTDKSKAIVKYGESSHVAAEFTYIPQIVVDIMTFEDGELTESSVGGTVTMNPKDGLVPSRKSITLTAKAAKDYAFQGWASGKYWDYGEWWNETAETYKITNLPVSNADYYTPSWLYSYIDPADRKVHFIAVFKAIADYSEDDIVFNGFWGYNSSADAEYDGSGNASVTVKAVVGCALDEDYALECSALASPLAYKLDGKLPDGLKFDAKTGVLSGAPKKAGSSTVTITATDPAKNAKSITVYIEVSPLPTWLVGEYRGIMSDEEETGGYWDSDPETGEDYWVDSEYLPGPQNGILEMSVKSDGKVSAKVITRAGTRSVSGTLTWEDSDVDAVGVYKFWHEDAKDDSWCHVNFNSDGTIDGYVDSYLKSEDEYAGGDMVGMRQDTELLVDSPFANKYYTFAFHAETTEQSGYWDDESGDWVDETYTEESGYGYLTLKTDTKGVAKVTGQLPDGEKVSMSALVLPFGDEARLYVFASPSAYKKADWFAAALTLTPDGSVFLEDHAIWTPWVDISEYPGGEDYCGDDDMSNSTVSGIGAEYSSAQSIADYYWNVSCEWDYGVELEYRWKVSDYDDYGRKVTYTDWDVAEAQDFDGYLFNVAVKGDNKGAISLAGKSPAPWKDGDEWNYWEDKNGNRITDPSQLSISFTRATGIFTGKATVYFDYEMPDTGKAQHATATLPYAGVMIDDGEGGYEGFGSAVYTSKCQYDEDKPFTKKVTLPVSLELAE